MSLEESSVRILILAFIFFAALVAESIWPLRKATQPKLTRVRRNLGVAAVSAILLRFLFLPLELSAAAYVTKEDIGLLNSIALPSGFEFIFALLLLDYTLYIWHFLNHRIPFLWRFHNAHHTDLDLDASTATRFHFGELGLSAFYRVGQIFILGIDIQTLLLFETLVTAFALFHHANVRLPLRIESWVSKILVAQRMHGIHHSIVRTETDSNFGTILSVWDRIHRTLKVKIPQNKITIGNPAYRSLSEQSFLGILTIPFRKQRAWILPDGTNPRRD